MSKKNKSLLKEIKNPGILRLVLNESKGGVASAWMLYEMKSRNLSPKAILFN